MRREVRATVCIAGRTFVVGTEQARSWETGEQVWRIDVAESYPTGAGTYRTHEDYGSEADALAAAFALITSVALESST